MTSPVSSVSTPTATVPSTTNLNAASVDNTSLSPDAFLQLLVAQLKYQDPSKPVDTSTFMNETATLSQVQTMQTLSSNSVNTLNAQQVQAATSMVGHNISYTDSAGNLATGLVSAATISGTTPSLQVGTKTVALTDVQQVLSS
ncbi:flagellar basal-body rod modification protein FlgD [Jatrophihabitans sp. GAS493]|uniref:flagellar hook assembly protein FlgD n=1 Tax=Jatrophihabitans sp. GAS493 TaxID=1907575 RepID=UPI000BB7731E|nr:flagellar hook capping FlgD N-terminal domain-containing protein [Jatrophihabitans sp. GAS493]SOD71331.1 flagellar basal-body rod modification protein FlgD [Jatrophihabitans sp. GAS493]